MKNFCFQSHISLSSPQTTNIQNTLRTFCPMATFCETITIRKHRLRTEAFSVTIIRPYISELKRNYSTYDSWHATLFQGKIQQWYRENNMGQTPLSTLGAGSATKTSKISSHTSHAPTPTILLVPTKLTPVYQHHSCFGGHKMSRGSMRAQLHEILTDSISFAEVAANYIVGIAALTQLQLEKINFNLIVLHKQTIFHHLQTKGKCDKQSNTQLKCRAVIRKRTYLNILSL